MLSLKVQPQYPDYFGDQILNKVNQTAVCAEKLFFERIVLAADCLCSSSKNCTIQGHYDIRPVDRLPACAARSIRCHDIEGDIGCAYLSKLYQYFLNYFFLFREVMKKMKKLIPVSN